MNNIKKVGVIGAGTMGAGIAGQVANAGLEVWLLDLPSDGENVNSLAERIDTTNMIIDCQSQLNIRSKLSYRRHQCRHEPHRRLT